MTKMAEEIMSKNLITIELNDSVLEAYRAMQKNKIRHLPVLDEGGGIIGILSDRDVQRCIRYDRESRSQLLDVELSLDPSIKVGSVMSWPVHKVQGDVPIRDVALRMLNEKISSMLVECPQNGKRGIVTTDDLIHLLIILLDKDPSRLRLAVNSLVEEFALP